MIGPMDPAGFLLGLVRLLWCGLCPAWCVLGRPPHSCTCVAALRWKGTDEPPYFNKKKKPLAVFRCGAWLRVLHKPADPGTNAAVKHQSWQLMQTILIAACSCGGGCSVCACVCVCVCVCTSIYFNARCTCAGFEQATVSSAKYR